MAWAEIPGLILFLVVNLAALSFAFKLAANFNLKGTLLWVACLEIYLFFITVLVWVLGMAFILKPLWLSALVIALGAWAWAGTGFRKNLKQALRAGPVGFGSTMLSTLMVLTFFVIFLDAVYHPFFPHDPLTYELFFPAKWLQAGRLDLVPTPFGDNSRAYDAANAILFNFWLMFPLGHDLFGHSSQFFLVALSVLCLTAISEELGLGKPASLVPALFFISIPLVMREATTAHSDFFLTAQLLAFFTFVSARLNRKAGAEILAAISLGLLAGSKYLALSHLPLLIPGMVIMLRPWPRPRRLLAMIILCLAGGYWYMRNWAMTGNPLFPLQVELGPHVVFAGAYTREIMNNWIYKIVSARQLLAIITDGPRPEFQTVLMVFLAASSLVALSISLFNLRRKGAIWSYLAVYPWLSHLIVTYLAPFHMDRFWIPAWAMAAVSIAVIIARYRSLQSWAMLAAFLLAAVEIGIYAGSDRIKAWSVLYPSTITPGLVLKLLIPAIALTFLIRKLTLGGKTFLAAAAFIAVSFQTMLAGSGSTGYFGARDKAMEFNQEARFLDSRWRGARIAYTGRNTPYPFLGERLTQQVFYANVNNHSGWKFHDYAAWFRERFPEAMPNTPEPAYYRLEENFRDWRLNLEALNAELVVICPIGVNELVNICHDRAGFPVEDKWAALHPQNFELVFESKCRIYRVAPGTPVFAPEDIQTRYCPLDALALWEKSPAEMEKYFPYALDEIQRYNLKPLTGKR